MVVSTVFVAAGLSCLLARPKTSSFHSPLMQTGKAKTSKSLRRCTGEMRARIAKLIRHKGNPAIKTEVACVLWRVGEEVGEETTA